MEGNRLEQQLGLTINSVGFGGIPIQRITEAEGKALVKEALSQGINFFDSARGYTDSEYKLGLGFKAAGVPRQDYLLASKSMARTADGIYQDVLKSLHEFDTDYIDLYQLHNVKEEAALEQVLAPDGALAGLERAVQEGKIRAIGITGHVMEILVKAIKTGKFLSVQFPFNAIEDQAKAEVLPLAQSMNLATIIMKPLAGGALREADKALAYLLKHQVTVVIPGMESSEQVHQNISVARQLDSYTEADMAAFVKEAKELGQQFCRRCEYCLPCPQGVNIPVVFLLNGYWERYGLQDWAIDRYDELPGKADLCEDCGLCEGKCPYALPIREMLKKSHQQLQR